MVNGLVGIKGSEKKQQKEEYRNLDPANIEI